MSGCLQFQHKLDGWTAVTCPIFQHCRGGLDNMPGCPIFLNFGERLDKNLVQGSSKILEPWTIARLSTDPGYAGRLVNYSLSNIPTLQRKSGQLASLSALLASWGKIRHVHLVPSSRIYEKGWTTCHLVQSSCIFLGRKDNNLVQASSILEEG